MTVKTKRITGMGGLFCALAMLAGAAQAGPLGSLSPCPAADGVDIADFVTGTSNCGVDFTATQDSETVVNAGSGYFAVTNWTMRSKFDDMEEGGGVWEDGITGGLSFTSEGDFTKTGSWTIDANVWSEVSQLMFVLKSGQNPLVAYLIGAGTTSGSYNSPFVTPPFDLPGQSQLQDISHISVYEVSQVPEPSVVALLALGLLGFAWVGRRRGRGNQPDLA